MGDAHNDEVSRLPKSSPIPILLQLECAYLDRVSSLGKPTLFATPFAKPPTRIVSYEPSIKKHLKLINW